MKGGKEGRKKGRKERGGKRKKMKKERSGKTKAKLLSVGNIQQYS